MSITIESAEAEALLDELTRSTHRSRPDLLLDLLRRERTRLEREIEEGRESARLLRQRVNARPLVDPRSVDDILAYDENGLPV